MEKIFISLTTDDLSNIIKKPIFELQTKKEKIHFQVFVCDELKPKQEANSIKILNNSKIEIAIKIIIPEEKTNTQKFIKITRKLLKYFLPYLKPLLTFLLDFIKAIFTFNFLFSQNIISSLLDFDNFS